MLDLGGLGELLDLEPDVSEPLDAVALERPRGLVECEGVGFSYSPGSGQKTTIRGGFGLMFGPQAWDDYNRAVSVSPDLPFKENGRATRWRLSSPAPAPEAA